MDNSEQEPDTQPAPNVGRPLVHSSDDEYSEVFKVDVSRRIRNNLTNSRSLNLETKLTTKGRLVVSIYVRTISRRGVVEQALYINDAHSEKTLADSIDNRKIVDIRAVRIIMDGVSKKRLNLAFVYTVEKQQQEKIDG